MAKNTIIKQIERENNTNTNTIPYTIQCTKLFLSFNFSFRHHLFKQNKTKKTKRTKKKVILRYVLMIMIELITIKTKFLTMKTKNGERNNQISISSYGSEIFPYISVKFFSLLNLFHI